MKIKRATKKDARKISILRRKTLKEINKNDYPQEHLQFLINENSTQEIINKMKERDIFCMWEKNILLGTIELKEDKVLGLFIKSAEIGKGIGIKFMDFIEDYARSKKIKQLRLYSTKFAFNFYKKRGYHLIPSGYWVIGKSKSKDKVMIKKL
ncbi:MAG: GNAT family N-acetyltransferase [Nanoarchaeota archaeon]|nr:GNAT family N-acetyltransferase [Nanoarchaeota archaeon]